MSAAELLGVAAAAADMAADLLTTRAPGRLTAKGDRDFASEVDYSIERALRRFLAEQTPDIGFVGEELAPDLTRHDRWWALDPIDGTINFAHDLPLCGISLGLIERDRPVLGVVDLPFLGARYSAVEGAGAYRGDRRIKVSETAQLADALVTIGDYAVGPDAAGKNEERIQLTQLLAGRVLRIRMLGSAAIDLVWLAEGRTDASIALSNHAWDVAAGVIIAREAGAVVSDLDGSDHSTESAATIAAGPALAGRLHELIRAPIGPQQGARLPATIPAVKPEVPATIRPYRAADLEAVLALAQRLQIGVAPWRDPGRVAQAARGWVTAATGAASDPERDDVACWVAETGDGVSGFVSASSTTHFSGDRDAYVGELMVAETATRQGIGRQLMATVEQWAASTGHRCITLETGAANDAARSFYTSLGYSAEDVKLTKVLPDQEQV